MKHYLILPLILSMMLAVFLPLTSSAASESSYVVTLQQETPEPDPEHDKNPNNKGHRMPAMPIMIVITPEGIQSPLTADDIIYYELWSEDDTCLISVADEASFIDSLYSLSGEFMIRIITTEKSYIGYLSI